MGGPIPLQLAASSNQPQYIALSVEEAFTRGFNDFHYFSWLFLSDVMIYKLPELYIEIWLMLVRAQSAPERAKILRFALALPRGFAKTTFIKLLVCWFIVYDKITFILVVCATESHAHNFVSDVDDMLAAPDVERIYGNWSANKAIDSKEMKKCSYRRRIVILAAVGSGTSIRGIVIKHQRPDMVICDDMQTKENADSDAESERMFDWFVGTLLKAVSPFFAMVIYIGNMYLKNCILLKLKENVYWLSLVTGCILADGRSLWEELHPINALWEEFKHDESLQRAHIWFAEKQNDPISGTVSLLPDGSVPVCPFTPEELMSIASAGFIIIDPAGMKKASDDNVILPCLIADGIPYAFNMRAGQYSPLEVIQHTVEIGMELGIRVIFVEGVAYQSTLKFWFHHVLKEKGLENHFNIQDIMPKNRAKEGRIRTSTQQLLGISKDSRVIEPTWYIADVDLRQRYIFQALQYKFGKQNQRDDILDAAAYIEDVRAEFWDLVYSFPLNTLQRNVATVVANNTPF